MGDFGKSVEATSDFEVRLVTTESATYTITQLKNDTKYGLRLKHKSTQYEYRFCAQWDHETKFYAFTRKYIHFVYYLHK